MTHRSRTVPAAALVAVVASLVPVDAAVVDYRAVAARNGGTLTSPLLRRDATAQIRTGLAAIDHCPSVVVRRMSVTSFVSPHDPWHERWIVSDCRKTRPFAIEFIPTPDGGADMRISTKK